MIPVVLKLLSKAAKERRRAAIRYDGQHHLRVVEPHVVYMDSDGGVVAECYQVKGYSTAGKPPPFWKTFRVTKIDAVFLLGTTFEAQKSKNLTLKNPRRLIAMAYDRPPATPAPQKHIRPQSRDQEALLKQTRNWWTQVESAIDGFLSDEDQHPSRH
ncbi:MAG: WYL domain-containing protein [Gammaproteobacteria bacterium]|jgi:predicted DNA-binding transcriptional regulator YafY|nr:WYL domain-containing protein [Gammaproteobacteria bacterium]